MEEKLKIIFANVNEWLKFAEAKNAALIAADAAAAFGALTLLLGRDNNLALWLYVYLHSFVLFVTLSAITALLSVIPKTKILISNHKDEKQSSDNLLFYGHIAKYKPTEYLNELRSRYGLADSKNTGLEMEYAQQIVINSQITLTKYDIFRLATWLALTAILTPILAAFLFLFVRDGQSNKFPKIKASKGKPSVIDNPKAKSEVVSKNREKINSSH